MSTLSGIIDAHAGGLFTPSPPPPILPCLVWFIYSFFFRCLCSVFVHPLVNYPDSSLLPSPGERHYLPFSSRDIPLVFIRHPFPTFPGSLFFFLLKLSLLMFPLKSSFQFFSPPLTAFDCTKKQPVCVRSEISRTNVGQRWSASFATAVSAPKHGSSHTTTRGMMGNGWQWRSKRPETGEKKRKRWLK